VAGARDGDVERLRHHARRRRSRRSRYEQGEGGQCKR
jgi:hypothetical protein